MSRSADGQFSKAFEALMARPSDKASSVVLAHFFIGL